MAQLGLRVDLSVRVMSNYGMGCLKISRTAPACICACSRDHSLGPSEDSASPEHWLPLLGSCPHPFFEVIALGGAFYNKRCEPLDVFIACS
jgi:hypothetical protein